MRIISKFKDYWDSGMGQGQDRSLVFVREQQAWGHGHQGEPPASLRPFLDIAEVRPGSISLQRPVRGISEAYVGWGMLWVAGRLYPHAALSIRTDDQVVRGAPRYFYGYEELCAELHKLEYDLKEKDKEKSKRPVWRETLTATKFFEWTGSDKLLAHAFEQRIALASATGHEVKLNPRLADYEFFRKLPPFQAYQELSMFWGNLAAPDRVPVTVADKDRIVQHGFDEWSFRKMPEPAR